MKSLQIVRKVQSLTKRKPQTVPQDYFVGITQEPMGKVMHAHNLNKHSSFYTFFEATSEMEAKKAFNKLLDYDMNGFPVNGDSHGKMLYCYYIEGSTKEHAFFKK